MLGSVIPELCLEHYSPIILTIMPAHHIWPGSGLHHTDGQGTYHKQGKIRWAKLIIMHFSQFSGVPQKFL